MSKTFAYFFSPFLLLISKIILAKGYIVKLEVLI